MRLKVEVLVNVHNSLTVESTVTIPNSLKVESDAVIPQVLGGEDVTEETNQYTLLNDELEAVINSLPEAGGEDVTDETNKYTELNDELEVVINSLPDISECGEPYTGSYDVTPKIYEQKLTTKNKTMQDDVTVKSIPYYETSNLSNGTTVIIGGKLNE